MRPFLLLLFLLGWLVSSSWAADLTIKIKGQPQTIPFWPADSSEALGGVILVHCGHDEDDLFLQVLAQQLAQMNWSTAFLACDTHEQLWQSQLPATLSALRQLALHRLVLVYYGDQVQQPFNYFIQRQAKQVNGLILLSSWQSGGQALAFKSLRFPVMDVIGQFDYPSIVNQFKQRRDYFTRQQTRYYPLQVPGANHQFQYARQLLVSYLHGWMSKLPIHKPHPRYINGL